jgi:hypothetical protein
VLIILWLLCFARTSLYLAFFVLTPNQVLWH